MTQKELCEMCTEYSVDTECEHKDSCKLQAILKENDYLRKKLKEHEARESWDRFPEAMGR